LNPTYRFKEEAVKKLLVFVFIFVLAIGFLLAQESSLIILPNKNVGINTETPSSELEVNGRIKDKTGFVMPVGTIVPYGGATATDGWLLCDGGVVSRTTYADLFAVIGTAFGEGDGTTTFNLPDLRGMFLRGRDAGAGRDPDTGGREEMAYGGNTGDTVGSVQADAMQQLTGEMYNTYATTARSGITGVFTGSTMTGGSNATSPSYSGSHSKAYMKFDSANSPNARTSTETRPINAYVNFIIKI
jgi:microcystin-dependent protein